uniref:Phosphoglycolate phosphatase n=1 Tax=Aceria tosichella TaxID=561515 RepID=A0A6G1S8L7_9ACAR
MVDAHIESLDNKTTYDDFIDSFDTVVTDCDGVLYINNDPIDGVAKALNGLRRKGKKIIFATNNSTKNRVQFLQKLRKLGYEAHLDEVFPTSYSSALYLKQINFKRSVYVLGSQGIADELNNVGIKNFGVGPDVTPDEWAPGQARFKVDKNVGAVVVGFDNQVSFKKLAKACSYVKRPDCLFVASNADESFPSISPDIFVPGPGVYVSAIKAGTGRDPIVLGKPGTYFFDIIRSQHPTIDPARTIMIGDRLTTDMPFGHNNGMATLFVESGIGTIKEACEYGSSDDYEEQQCVPDYYLPSLAALNKYLTVC